MTHKVRNIRIGLFLAVTGTLVAVILIAFGGLRLWGSKDHYRIVFTGSVMGLEKGAAVHMNGIRVGKVESVALGQGTDEVIVGIAVDEGAPIREGTKATMQFAGITGLKVIDLRGGIPGKPRLAARSTIPTGETMLDKLEEKAKTLADQSAELMEKANRIVANLEQITDPEKLGAITTDLAATSASLRALVNENRAALRGSIASIDTAAKGASQLMARIEGLVADNEGTLRSTVARIEGLVTGNEGTLRSTMYDLRQASRSLKDLAREVRQKPSRLLFSSAQGDRKLP